VQSILQQTYQNFELIIINDGSRDGTWGLIESYKDSRVVGVNFEQNRGLINVLNHGLKLARGRYIARMDADDIALPKRFEKQVEYLEDHLDCGACGTAIINFGESGKTHKMAYPCKHEEITAALKLFERNICHPSVMLRTSVLRENNILYREEYLYAEDYKLWFDISVHSRLHNLKEPLLKYYTHSDQLSAKHYPAQMDASRYIVQEQLQEFLVSDERRFPEGMYIDFLVQEINGNRVGVTAAQSKEVYSDLLEYVRVENDIDFLYARRILLFKAVRASFQYKHSHFEKVKRAVACLLADPKLFIMSFTEFIRLALVYRFKSKLVR
jgi:glycosyltransferase involved in cell wall biosynthesis